DLAAALGELPVREDALLSDLHAADAAREPRRARDDVGHALPPRGQSRQEGARGTGWACCRSTWSRRLRTISRRLYEGSGVGLVRASLMDEDWAVSPRMV